MAKLINTTRSSFTLPSKHVIPRLGELADIPNDLITGDNWTVLNGLILSGAVVAEYDPEEPEPAAPVSKRKTAA